MKQNVEFKDLYAVMRNLTLIIDIHIFKIKELLYEPGLEVSFATIPVKGCAM